MTVTSLEVHLTPAEDLLRNLILCTCDSLSLPAGLEIETWFVGGWVRDRLLGIRSSDVDVALSNVTGKEFGSALKEYFIQHESELKQSDIGKEVPIKFSGPYLTKRNAEKSKHLQTAIVTVFGLDVDLVNLREEVYADDSRNPQIRPTTPYIDAHRRDLTINSLFYNLRSGKVEDYTGKGLSDLRNRIIRTPLDPLKTFTEDPLRILRAIRFASRFDYHISTEVFDTMRMPQVHEALGRKVSRERINIEIFKIANGIKPYVGFNLIYQLKLYGVVFLGTTDIELPTKDLTSAKWLSTWPIALSVLQELLQHNVLGSWLIAPNERGEICWLLAAYCPLSQQSRFTVQDVAEALKLTNRQATLLKNALCNVNSICSIIKNIAEGIKLSRGTVGMSIRSWGHTWKLQVLFALLTEVNMREPKDVLSSYFDFMQYVVDIGVHEAHLAKPILNGMEVQKLLELKKSGPFMKNILESMMIWQFNFQPISRDDAIAWVLKQRGTLIAQSHGP